MKLERFLSGERIIGTEIMLPVLTHKGEKEFYDYFGRNNFHIDVIKGLPYSFLSEKQYLNVFNPVDDEIIVDAGAYDCKTALNFIKWGGSKLKHIYSFEPDPLNVPKCEANLKGHEDKVTLINKGTWSGNQTMCINDNAAGTTSSRVSDDGTVAIELAAIDDIVKDEKVMFIKMDVEGADPEPLKGAKNTIIKNHPRLAICAYHKPEDLYELPGYVLSLVPEYKFYLRHYCSREWETVLYAFVN